MYLNKLENAYGLCYATDANVSRMIGTLSSFTTVNMIKKL